MGKSEDQSSDVDLQHQTVQDYSVRDIIWRLEHYFRFVSHKITQLGSRDIIEDQNIILDLSPSASLTLVGKDGLKIILPCPMFTFLYHKNGWITRGP